MTTAILLPIFRPQIEWLKRQLNSIASQSAADFRCIVSNDGKLTDDEHALFCGLLPDQRFCLVDRDEHLGTYRHVERLVSEYGLQDEFFALCDQDDVWVSDRLRVQLDHFEDGSVSAVSVNGQIVDSQERPLGGWTTFEWFGVSEKNLGFRLILNQVTGASMLCRSDHFRYAIPFPDNRGAAVHDHWLYIVATANGRVVFDERPLWMYRQHEANQIGASAQSRVSSRVVNGFAKAWSIVSMRLNGEVDPVVLQGLVFGDACRERWPEALKRDEVLFKNWTWGERLSLLRPGTLVQTRLESFRIALCRSDLGQISTT